MLCQTPEPLSGVSYDGEQGYRGCSAGHGGVKSRVVGGAACFQTPPPPAEPALGRKKVFPVHLLTQSSWGDGEVGWRPAAVQRPA